MKDNLKPCAVEPASRQVIERKLLTALDDEDKVALLLSSKDLNMLIDALGFASHMIGPKAAEMCRDLKQLRSEAFR